MDLAPLTIDIPAQPWSGRNDGDGAEHRRWWQAVTALGGETALGAALPAGGTRPAVLLGFCSDEGVRRNQGRVGASAAPAEIRAALGSLAWHGERTLYDAGDVLVSGAGLLAGQLRAGAALTAMLDGGALTVVLGGGHEIAYASYLGVVNSRRVREGARWGVLNLDAHFDLRDAPVPSSGTVFLQMANAEAEAGRSLNYAVVGISEPNNTRALFRTADQLDVKYLLDEDCSLERAREFVASFLERIDVLHLTIDLDVFEASLAPGVSAPAAYGVPLPVIAAICRQVAASGKLFHADVAELNPEFDIDHRTAKLAARLVNTVLRAESCGLS
ncbi:formimidoylglutamase [Arthrobacter sp. H14-L1]|uniref:formimidoylglutamase n=1 Tax=Arthrobacter sp. H14-L1 TaxID=2996697 RepID=UPI00226E5A2D|nr:formimidoylglutamase [Arthrobacter sp. H14-L1]MCY0904107.1 formimidoylglutamase [Arthrobacter sp. H14-L1]